jgi:peptidyl-Lys metalloendopeptidase
MRFTGLFLLFALCFAVPASAMTFERCSKVQIAYATDAIEGAREIALRAAAMVGQTVEYETWFGRYTKANSEHVRKTLKAIDRAMQSDDLVAVCPPIGQDGCSLDVFANVWPDDPFRVNLCHAFFRMPSMLGIVRTSSAFDSGTREGTLIHEVSHFVVVGGTDDYCYGRETCTEMARTDPDMAIDNADNYQYFVEDITFAYPMPRE